MGMTLPKHVSSTYDQSCRGLLLSGPLDTELSLAGIESTATLGDSALANWWSGECVVREAVWAAAADGDCVAIDWLLWTLALANERRADAFAGLLAVDVCDASQVTMAVLYGDDVDSIIRSEWSPGQIRAWLNSAGITPATTAWNDNSADGTNAVTAAWLNGRKADSQDEFEAALAGALTGAKIVVEFDHHFRRHVLANAGSTHPERLDSDQYCVDLLTRRTGWLTRLGKWTWTLSGSESGHGDELEWVE